jgi:hypothetical protein
MLFDGTLGDWKTKPVSFQLKEEVSPYITSKVSEFQIYIKTPPSKRWNNNVSWGY